MASTPLVALVPLRSASEPAGADVISVFVDRRDWSAWNLKALTPGAAIGVAMAWLLAAQCLGSVCLARHWTFAQVGARPFELHTLLQRLEQITRVGITALFFASVNVMKVIPYFSLRQFSADGLSVTLALLALAIGTNFLGIWLVRRTPALPSTCIHRGF